MMNGDEKAAVIATYLKYLRWNRLPFTLPTSRKQAAKRLSQITTRADENPYADEVDLFGIIHSEPELAWELLLEIIAEAEESELYLLGAGDLETFVSNQAVAYADRILDEIRTNTKFRKAFESLYLGGDMPALIGHRFNDALRDAGVVEENIIDWWSEGENV